jgi:hypothetical protein
MSAAMNRTDGVAMTDIRIRIWVRLKWVNAVQMKGKGNSRRYRPSGPRSGPDLASCWHLAESEVFQWGSCTFLSSLQLTATGTKDTDRYESYDSAIR